MSAKDVGRALYEAASTLMTRFRGRGKVKSWGQQLAKRSCHRKACVAVARKLAVIMHAIYGPAARCKGIRSGVAYFGLRQSIRPRMGACAPGHHGNPHTPDLSMWQASVGHACIQVSGAPGRPLCHPFQVTSQTVAGTLTLRVSHASRRRLHVRLESARKRTTVVKHAPRNARELVGQSCSQNVVMEPPRRGAQPSVKAKLGSAPWLRQYSAHPNNEERSHVLVATLAKSTEHRSIASGELFWHQAEPGPKVAALREGCAIADRGDHCARGHRADSWNAHQTLAAFVLARERLDFAAHRINPIVNGAALRFVQKHMSKLREETFLERINRRRMAEIAKPVSERADLSL